MNLNNWILVACIVSVLLTYLSHSVLEKQVRALEKELKELRFQIRELKNEVPTPQWRMIDDGK